MKKVILIDVDGTLLNYDNKLHESAISAIRKARKNGHLVYICTGRSKAEVYDYIWDIGIDGMIGGNGNYVESNGKVIMHQSLTLQECTEIVDWLHEKHLEFYLESNSGLYGSENFEKVGNPTIYKYALSKDKNTKEVGVKDIFPNMIFNESLYRNDINKISFILSSYNDYLNAKEKFKDLVVNTWGGKNETALFGDIGVKDIDKAVAIKCLLKHLNVDQKDTIAFGDAKIDIPMLAFCNVGIAMGNGGKEIKAMADYITKDVDEDGLYYAFEKYQLI